MASPLVDGGKTVRIILRGCDDRLADQFFNERVLTGLCRYIGMTQIGMPFTQVIPPGLSSGLIIAESHLFIHTWPESSSVRVVIDSCVDFNHDAAAEWLKLAYSAEGYTYIRM